MLKAPTIGSVFQSQLLKKWPIIELHTSLNGLDDMEALHVFDAKHNLEWMGLGAGARNANMCLSGSIIAREDILGW